MSAWSYSTPAAISRRERRTRAGVSATSAPTAANSSLAASDTRAATTCSDRSRSAVAQQAEVSSSRVEAPARSSPASSSRASVVALPPPRQLITSWAFRLEMGPAWWVMKSIPIPTPGQPSARPPRPTEISDDSGSGPTAGDSGSRSCKRRSGPASGPRWSVLMVPRSRPMEGRAGEVASRARWKARSPVSGSS